MSVKWQKWGTPLTCLRLFCNLKIGVSFCWSSICTLCESGLIAWTNECNNLQRIAVSNKCRLVFVNPSPSLWLSAMSPVLLRLFGATPSDACEGCVALHHLNISSKSRASGEWRMATKTTRNRESTIQPNICHMKRSVMNINVTYWTGS